MTREQQAEIEDWIQGPLTKRFLQYLQRRADALSGTRVFYPGEPSCTQEVLATINGGVQELEFMAGLLNRDADDLAEVFGDEE